MTSKSKKLLKVIDGLRAWNLASTVSGNAPKPGMEIKEILKSDHFQLGTIMKHGLPYQPSCMAFDPVQRILAVGTKLGSVILFGRPGVEFHLEHPTTAAVIQLIFLVNEGGLISICDDSVVHLWNIRQKPPDIVHSLHFKRDTLTCGYLAVSSSWLSVGSEQGNVHFVNVQQFTTSGYVINWNRAINVTQSQRPGSVVQLAEHPQDSNHLLIGYSSGLLVLWDLRAKAAESRFHYHETLFGFAWHWDGKMFVSAHTSGTLVTWALNQPKRPHSVTCPHAGDGDTSDSQYSFEPIRSVQWLPTKTGEGMIVFTGGSRRDSIDAVIDGDDGDSLTPSITILRGKRLAVMQMDFPVVTCIALCTSPYFNEACDPYAVAVLLQQDLVLVDLISPGYPSFENPYPMDIASSPVTACHYVVDCPSDLVPAFYSVGSRGKRAATGSGSRSASQEGTTAGDPQATSGDSFSSRKWPIDGGEWGTNLCSYQELIITGHADGSVRFWDASGVNLSPLYKVRTSRFFDRASVANAAAVASMSSRLHVFDVAVAGTVLSPEEVYTAASAEPLAVRHIRFCVESRTLLLAGQRHLCLLSFCRTESAFEIPVLDVYLSYEEDQGVEPSLGTGDETSSLMSSSSGRRGTPQIFANSTSHSTSPNSGHPEKESKVTLTVRSGVRQWSAGYQPSLVCRLAATVLPQSPSECPEVSQLLSFSPISTVALTSAANLFAFGTDGGVTVVDYYQGICLVCVAIPEIEAMDPMSRMRQKSSSRFANLGNGAKSTSSMAIASPAATSANQPTPQNDEKRPSKIAPPTTRRPGLWQRWRRRDGKKDSNSRTSREVRHLVSRRTSAVDENSHSRGRRLSSFPKILESLKGPPIPQEVFDNLKPLQEEPRRPTFPTSPSPPESAPVPTPLVPQISVRIFDFRGGNIIKPKVIENPSPGVIHAVSPVFASMMHLRLEPARGELNALPSPTSDKYGDNTSQRHSDTSEQSSIDQSVLEGIRTLAFVDMSDRKNEPSLWVGTNRGSVFGFTIETPEESSPNTSNYNLLGSLFKFDGEVVYIGFGNAQGEICAPPAVKWDAGTSAAPRRTLVPDTDGSAAAHETPEFPLDTVAARRLVTQPPSSPSASTKRGGKHHHSCSQGAALEDESSLGQPGESLDHHFMVVVTEKHAQVIGFPSRNCYNRVKITETSAVIRAELANQRMSPSAIASASAAVAGPPGAPTTLLYVGCLLSNGHVVAFSVPGLRILSDVDVVGPRPGVALGLFAFGNLGHALLFPSPSQLAKISLSADLSNNLNEMHGELFLPCNMPEPPKKNFFSNLFNAGGLTAQDRDALFGEQQSGKSTSGTAALLPSGRGEKVLTNQASGATSEIARARNAAIERGEKLSQLDMQTQEMVDQSKSLSKTAAMLAARYEKQDKWWGVWPR